MEQTWKNFLRAELKRRQGSNPLYGVRAFARQLEISPAQLSQMISGKRPVGPRMAERLAKALGISASERRLLLDGAAPEPAKHALDEEHFAVIAHWVHFALLALSETKDCRSDVPWLSRRLGLPMNEVREALERLLRLQLIEIRGSALVSTTKPLQTTSDVASASIRRSHRLQLELAAQKLEEVPVEWREFTTLTLPVNVQKLKQAKALVKKFKRDMEELLESGKKTEVYSLAVQLYPLTALQKEAPL